MEYSIAIWKHYWEAGSVFVADENIFLRAGRLKAQQLYPLKAILFWGLPKKMI